jgi:hypothetical protein
MKVEWAIQNTIHPELFWNNDYGWGDYKGAQIFRHNAPKTLNLPIDGKWIIKIKGGN